MHNMIIRKHYDELCLQLERLHALLSELDPQSAIVAQIPHTPRSAEHEPVNKIVPVIYTGTEAVEVAASAYKDLHTIVGLSQKSARRTPGVIWIDTKKGPAASEVAVCIEAINKEKASIKDYVVNNFEHATQRFEILKQSCPGVMTLHLYRIIRCYYQEDLKTVRFSWAQQQALQKPDKTILMKNINLAIEHAASQNIIDSLSTLHSHVKQVPQDSLRIRRQVKVQPVANITTEDGRAKSVTAPLPMIVVQEDLPVIKIIGEFNMDASGKRKKRSDKLETSFLGFFQGGVIEEVKRK